MLKRKKNYKILIGFIIGIIISITGVYATVYYGAGTDLTYDNTSSGLTSTNVQDALVELYDMKSNSCPDDTFCEKYKTTLSLGDYIYYTPSSTSYTTDTDKTGYSSTQTINPSELNLWRVLNINDDGTIDLISEYVSSVDVYFYGQTGYLNYIGYLNVLASQYENSAYTTGSRYFGYNGQTEYITDTSMFTNQAPWTCNTGGSCNPVESQGGGDTLYEADYNQASTVLGTLMANNVDVGTTKATDYWLGSRYYYYSSSSYYYWRARYIYADGSLNYYNLYYSSGSSFYSLSYGIALRPIVTLKSGLTYGEGTGGSYSPMKILITGQFLLKY